MQKNSIYIKDENVDHLPIEETNCEVTPDGRIWSLKGHVYRRFVKNNGHANIVLKNINRKLKPLRISVDRLVAITFLSNPDDKPIVHHIDFDCMNNNVSNLKWVTGKESAQLWKQYRLLNRGAA